MELELALKFLKLGYPIRSSNWGRTEFVALNPGGKFSYSECNNYAGFGISKIVADLCSKLNTNKSSIELENHLLKFDGPCSVKLIDSSLPLFDDYGIYDESGTDYIKWKKGTILTLDKKQLKVVDRVFEDVLVEGLSNKPEWHPILELYTKGFRLKINKKKLN